MSTAALGLLTHHTSRYSSQVISYNNQHLQVDTSTLYTHLSLSHVHYIQSTLTTEPQKLKEFQDETLQENL